MASTKTYTVDTTGNWAALAVDSTGTYETSEVSNVVSNMPILQYDMTNFSGWSTISSGTHTLTIKAKADGYITSEPSTAVSFTKLVTYSIQTNLDHVTADSSNPTTIQENGTATLIFTPESGYVLPENVSVSGATSTWTIIDE